MANKNNKRKKEQAGGKKRKNKTGKQDTEIVELEPQLNVQQELPDASKNKSPEIGSPELPYINPATQWKRRGRPLSKPRIYPEGEEPWFVNMSEPPGTFTVRSSGQKRRRTQEEYLADVKAVFEELHGSKKRTRRVANKKQVKK